MSFAFGYEHSYFQDTEKMFCKRLASTLLLIFSTVGAPAGDASEFEPLGFSRNGEYNAFAEKGVGDGSGFPYAKVAVVEVARNVLVAHRAVVLEYERATEEQALAKALREADLEPVRHQTGREPGQRSLGAPADRPRQVYTNNLFSFDYRAEGGAVPIAPRYEVLVESKDGRDTTDGQHCSDWIGTAPKLLKLSIADRKATDGFITVLQEDKELPRSRSCVSGYVLRRVTAFAGGIVVVLSYSGPGFEGPDVRHMVVTAEFAPHD
jgi:predicted secreted protein